MYSYETVRLVKDRIEKRRLDAIETAEEHAAEVRAISPEIRKIDNELSKTGLAVFRAALDGEDIEPIKERNQRLIARRSEILRELGYPADYSDIHYTCKACGDTGYVGTRMCSCLHRELVTEAVRASGMGRLIERQSFDNFDIEKYRCDADVYAKMKINLLRAREFVKNFRKTGENLLFVGPTGTGKTHLSTAIAKEAIERGADVVYDSAQNMISAFETDKFRGGSPSYEPKGDRYLECDLLIIDDLGAEFRTAFSTACLYNILNTRQNNALSTVISSNYTLAEIGEKYEGRISSRLFGTDYTLCLFGGRDQRI